MAIGKLALRIIWGITVILALAGLSILLLMETVVRDDLGSYVERRGVTIARYIGEMCTPYILTERYFEVELMIREIRRKETGIEYVFILDPGGGVIAHTFENGFPVELRRVNPDAVGGGSSVRRIVADDRNLRDIAIPLQGGEAGTVHVGMSEEAIDRDVNRLLKQLLLLAGAVMLVTYVSTLFMLRRIVKPVVELAGMAEAVGKGDFDRRAPVRSDDEIGALSAAFNDMVRKRKEIESEREALIERLRETLKKVRTLSGMLPICAWCKKIRNDKGYWASVESYIAEHSDAEFSHSICPECEKKMRMRGDAPPPPR